MTDDTLRTLVRLWDDLPTGTPPVDRLVTTGRSVRRKRRGRLAAGAAALTVAAALVGGAVDLPGGPSSTEVATQPTTPPAGSRLVGIGQVVVAVPEVWVDVGSSCAVRHRATVVFLGASDCRGVDPAQARVEIAAGPPDDTGFQVVVPRPAGEVDGHRVLSGGYCRVGVGEACLEVFGVPDLRAWFTVSVPASMQDGPEVMDAIRRSLAVLPDGQTTVPAIPEPLSSVPDARDLLRARGFTVRVEHPRCPATADCVFPATTPPAGAVVTTGSEVTIIDP